VIVGRDGRSVVERLVKPSTVRTFGAGFAGAASGRRVDRYSAAGIPAFFAAIRLLAQTGGTMPLRVHDAKCDIVRGSDVAIRLGDQPNPESQAESFWASVIAHVVAEGNAFLAKLPASDGFSIPELWLLPPEGVQVYRDEAGTIRYDVTVPGGVMMTGLSSVSILHIKGWTLRGDHMRGDSIVGMQAHALGNSLAAQEYQGRVWQRGAVPRGVLSSDEPLTREQIQTVREEWEAAYGGLENSGRTAVLPRGASYQAVSVPHKDAQFIEQMQYGVDDIARMFNIPASFLGGESGASLRYENATYNDIHLLKFPLRAPLKFIEAALTADRDILGGVRDRWHARFDPDDIIRPDIAARYQMHATGIRGGFLTPNDAREKEGLEPLSGGDELFQPTRVGSSGGGDDAA
jgi:HK97 family phage portal protein